jgi:acetyl-CoA carboxylase carboxyltransferase component
VAVLATAHRADTDEAMRNRTAMLERIGELDAALAEARAGGGERYVQRHRDRGKLPVRERIELLLDRDAPFLELQPVIAWGTSYHTGGSMVCGIGVIEGVECMIAGHDPTVRGGANNPFGVRKTLRALDVAHRNRLPFVNLTESAGADLPAQAELFIPGGAVFRGLTRLSADGIPTIALVFGSSTAGGAYVPGMSDYTVFVDGGARVFLGGPPLVKMATGEDADAEELGGARSPACRTTWRPASTTRSASGARSCATSTGASRVRVRGRRRPRRCTTRQSSRTSSRPTCACRSTPARCSPACSTGRATTSSSRSTDPR